MISSRNLLLRSVAVVIVALAGAAPATSYASFVYFYNVTNQNTVGRLAPTYDFGSVTATAGQMPPGVVKSMTVANFSYNQPDEVGLGVCGSSDGGSLCDKTGALQQLNLSTSLWTGDITEIDNLGNNEMITLSANAGYAFTGQFLLGSLDDNSTTTNYEDGYVTYGANTVRFARTASGATITAGSATIVQAGPQYGSEVFLLTISSFDPAITQVKFGAGGTGSSGTNNDYLLAGANMSVVPVPAAAWLLASALGVAGSLRRRQPA